MTKKKSQSHRVKTPRLPGNRPRAPEPRAPEPTPLVAPAAPTAGGKTAGLAPNRSPDVPPLSRSAIRVRAIRMGYYDHIRRRVGDVFMVPQAVFSKKWMEMVSSGTPERMTTGQEQLRRDHDEILGGRSPGMLTEEEPNADQNPLSG